MDERFRSNISFYMKANKVHVFIEALRGLGSPTRICFLLNKEGSSLLVIPYRKRDFKSHAVPKEVYNGRDRMEVNSMKLCKIIANLHGWDMDKSYRIPGMVYPEKRLAVFNLERAFLISKTEEQNEQ